MNLRRICILLLLVSGVGRAETLILPADSEKLRALAQVSFIEQGTGRPVLRVTDVSQPVTVRIPSGVWLKPVAGEKAPVFLIWKDAVFSLQPGAEPTNHTLATVLADIDQWGRPMSNAHWEASLPERSLAQERLSHFFPILNSETNIIWSCAQIGAAVILQNVHVARLYDKSLTIHPPNAGVQALHLYSYEAVEQVRALFEKAGLRPSSFHLFADNDDNLEKVLQAHTVRFWDDELLIPHAGNLFSGLAGYASSPRVRELLLTYVRHHTDESQRLQAALALIDFHYVTGSNDELFQQATTDPNRLLRFAAASALAQRQDWRGAPLLAVFSHDQWLIGPFEKDWTAHLTRLSGVQPQPAETLWTFWVRTGGWDRLATEHDVTALKVAVAKLQAQEETDLDTRLTKASSGNGQNLKAALALLPRRFSRDPKVDAWVSNLASTHSDANLRLAALRALRNLELFDHCDLLTYLLDNDPVASVRTEAVYTPWSADAKRRTDFFLQTIRRAELPVRLGAVHQLDKAACTPAVTDILTEIARTGSTPQLRIETLRKLVQFDPANSAPLIRDVIATADPAQQSVVVEAVKLRAQVQPDADGLTLLKQTATQHPLAAARAAAFNLLDGYSRRKFSVLDVALDGVMKDTDAAVQISAVDLAQRQYALANEKESASLVIAAGLNSSFPHVRARAINAAVDLKLATLEPRLIEIAKTEINAETRDVAYSALQKMNPAVLLDVLAVWVRSENALVRHAAVQHLTHALANDPRTKVLLKPLANDPDGGIKLTVTQFLGLPD